MESAVLRLLLVIMLLAGVFVYFRANGTTLPCSGLEPAMALLSVGRTVSPQYHGKLMTCLVAASKAYDASFGPEPHLDTLRINLIRARSAVQELLWRAPADSCTQSKLRKGKDEMTALLMAWVKDVKQRWKLLPEPHDSDNFWDGYYISDSGVKGTAALSTAK